MTCGESSTGFYQHSTSSPAHTTLHVITGLVPVIPIVGNAAPHQIAMAGERCVMTGRP